ncbi:uncharacterized protein [Miscanthus floridulus]|uniref:uncharacterized protein n=1 Tax=Miscanthus floridulus TaxID=154761 RepID=UPI003458EACF
MARNGDIDLTEERTLEKSLRCMSRKCAQIVMPIETLLDFEQLTVEDVSGRLKAVHVDATLFLVHGCIELQQDIGEGVKGPSFPLSRSAGSAELHLDEPCTYAFLDKGAANDKIDGWYLDTGATHHMTGRYEFFSDLDSGVKGSIKFEIKGVGSVIFKAKTWEHHLLTGVYYILALKNSIISIGQLDKNGSWVEIEDGMMRI